MMEISSYIPDILLAYSTSLLGMASPGPNIIAVIGTAMSIGRSAGIALALGVAAGSFCWASLMASGLTVLLASYAAALTFIKIAGGLYLLSLACKAFRSAARAHDVVPTTCGPTGRSALVYFIRGFTIQMTNPKAALSWIAVIALGLPENAPVWVGLSSSGVRRFSRPSFIVCMPWRFRRLEWCACMPVHGDGFKRCSAPSLP
jgi:amino acid exporter